MAQFNQSSGKTNAAWRERYARREERTLRQVAALRELGHDAAAIEQTSHGPGVPGGIAYKCGITINGERISKKQIKALLGE